MDKAKLIFDILEYLSKPRDFVLTTISILIMSIYVYLNKELGGIHITSLILISGIFGLMISKFMDMKCIIYLWNKHKTIRKCNSFIRRIKSDFLTKKLNRLEKKTYIKLCTDAKTILNDYNDGLLELEDFKENVEQLVIKYKEIAYLIIKPK